jgi:hypothetical protein
VIKPYSADDNHLYDSYVHASAKTFFKNYTNRRAWLLPFYNCCPYVFLSIGCEAAFVHGGLHLTDGTYSIEAITRYQKTLDISKSFYSVIREDDNNNFLSSEKGPLWTRYYAEQPAPVVSATIDKCKDYKMIVVGHCQTESGNFKHYDAILQEPEYSAFTSGGLVLLGCKDGSGCPRLAFVDIGMSCCFRNNKDWSGETDRRAEFLHLQHDPKKIDANRWYNVVKREVVSDGSSIVAWSAGAVAGGAVGAVAVGAGAVRGSRRKKRARRSKLKHTYRRGAHKFRN